MVVKRQKNKELCVTSKEDSVEADKMGSAKVEGARRQYFFGLRTCQVGSIFPAVSYQ
jgi:hypothetical protein